MRSVIRETRRLTVREVSEEVGICKSCMPHDFDRKIEDASYCRKICASSADRTKTEPRHSQELLDRSNSDENVLKNVITGDETWVYGYDVETKVQS